MPKPNGRLARCAMIYDLVRRYPGCDYIQLAALYRAETDEQCPASNMASYVDAMNANGFLLWQDDAGGLHPFGVAEWCEVEVA